MAVIAGGARRIDGPEKLRGDTLFTQDLKPHGLLHVKLVLSTVPSARIRSIDLEAARGAAGVVAVLTSADLGPVDVSGPDQPLATGKVYYTGQPVAAVVAETDAAAIDGAALVYVDYEELTPVLDPIEAMKDEAPLVLEEKSEGFDDVSIHGDAGNEQPPAAQTIAE